MDTQSITGGPGTLTLGGTTYLVGQPTEKDMGAIAAFLKQHAKSPVAALQDDPDFKLLPEDEQRQKLLEAARQKFDQNLPYAGPSILDALTSLHGVRFMAWILIRKAHPEVALEEISCHVTDDNRVAISVQLDIASGMAALGN